MAKDQFRLFTAERMGLLTVSALLLFIAAVSMCSRGGCSSKHDELAADSVIARQIDSVSNASADTVRAREKKPAGESKKRRSKKSKDVARSYLDERVD